MSVRVLKGDCRDVLATLSADSIHCVVTSPPYWGLRDYNIEPTVWGGEAACEHAWDNETVGTEIGRGNWAQGVNGRGEEQPGGVEAKREPIRASAERAFCRHCGAWRGAYGLEPTIDLYVAHSVEIFRLVRRVLRNDGTLWLNLGDSYASGAGPPSDKSTLRGNGHVGGGGLKPKDLCGMPWRVAFALQADGWYLRQDIIWSKPNPMPESVTDRCTRAHEYLFLLTRRPRYFYDAEAIRESAQYGRRDTAGQWRGGAYVNQKGAQNNAVTNGGGNSVTGRHPEFGRNKRSVWEIPSEPFPEAHFATFPPALIEPAILAGTSERGCCAKCGAPWRRQIEKSGGTTGKSWHDHQNDLAHGQKGGSALRVGLQDYQVKTTGWSPSCECDAAAVPCTVLDPFGGSGTVGLVALNRNRNCILIDLNDEYVAMARRRVFGPLFAGVAE